MICWPWSNKQVVSKTNDNLSDRQYWLYEGLAHDCSNSIANALELL